MPLKVVTGRANAGKTGWILKWALEALKQGDPPTLVVPNLADVRRLQRELSGRAPLGVRVLTFHALAEELWQLHGDGRGDSGTSARSAVVRKILESPLPDGTASSARAPGFERFMAQIVRQSAPTSELVGRAPADALVLDLLKRYEEVLGGVGLIEPGWIGSLLDLKHVRTGLLGFVRFITFSPAEVQLLSALSEENAVCVALTWEEGFAPTAANDSLAAGFLKRAEEIQVAAESLGGTELDAVADRLYAGDGSLRPSGQIILGEARGREAEAALVAGMAARAIRAGTAPERVAVVFGQVAPRVHVVRNAMAAVGLDVAFDTPLTISATSFGRALIALLSVATGRGARVPAMTFLQGPFSDSDAGRVALLDATWRRRRQTEDSGQVLAALIGLGGMTGRAASLCREVARKPLDGDSSKNWHNLADTLVAAGSARGAQEDAGEDAGAYRAVTTAVAEMASVPGHPFQAADVLDALPTLPCAMSAEETTGRVQVIQASRIGSRRFDEVFVAGLTQVEFPQASQSTFASEVRSLLTGGSVRADAAMARLEFYSLITRARTRLSLIRQTVSSDGKPQLASLLLEEVLDLYRGREGTPEAPGDPHRGFEVVRCEDARAFTPVFTAGRREQRLASGEGLPAVRTVTHGSVAAESARRLVKDRVFSATEITDYLECPYRWFYTRVLRPGEIDSDLDAAALGSRAHRIIADFYGALSESGEERVTRETLSTALELFERTADRSERDMPIPLDVAEEIDTGRARSWARHVVEDDADLLPGYVPFGHEVEFGRETAFEFGGVPIAGRIDRIDIAPAGIVVTDYKSSRDIAKLARPGDGSGIQHIVYARAAEHLLGQPVVGSVYRSLRSRRLRGFWRGDLPTSLPGEACDKDVIDAEGFSAMVAALEARVGAAVEGMEAGRIPRLPRTADSCRYCTLKNTCEGATS